MTKNSTKICLSFIYVIKSFCFIQEAQNINLTVCLSRKICREKKNNFINKEKYPLISIISIGNKFNSIKNYSKKVEKQHLPNQRKQSTIKINSCNIDIFHSSIDELLFQNFISFQKQSTLITQILTVILQQKKLCLRCFVSTVTNLHFYAKQMGSTFINQKMM